MSSYERPTYTATLLDPVTDRLAVMKAIRHLWPDVSLEAAKLLIKDPPCLIRSGIRRVDLDAVRHVFYEAGAAVEFTDEVYGQRL